MKTMDVKENYLGVRGWVRGGNYKLERYLYTSHRATALFLILFVIYHLITTTFFRMQGQSLWDSILLAQANAGYRVIEYLVVLAFTFHALNGARLILMELGIILGKPTRPIYPFKDALRKKRFLTYTILALVGIIAVIFLFDFIVGG